MAKLSEFTLITNEEFIKLKNPEYVGQTSANEAGLYYMCFESEGKLYKIRNILLTLKGDMSNDFNEMQEADYLQ